MTTNTSSEAVKSVSSYLKQVKSIQTRWNGKPGQELWFRAEPSNYKTKLFPKLYRPDHPVDFLLERELRIVEDFRRCGTHLCNDTINTPFDWYAHMQHHGAPTRLLDWSDGALVALHFAVKKTATDNDARFVYVLDPNWLNDETPTETDEGTEDETADDDEDEAIIGLYLPEDMGDISVMPQYPLVISSPQVTRRMGAQRSRFILCGRDRHWLPSKLDEHGTRLTVIKIEENAAPALREELRICGITESVIFPDLDGLGREIVELWDILLSA